MTKVQTDGKGSAAAAGARLSAVPLAADEIPADAAIEDLAPRQIVTELDKFVVGQKAAKRAVAIALT